jgi:hypothetical protein
LFAVSNLIIAMWMTVYIMSWGHSRPICRSEDTTRVFFLKKRTPHELDFSSSAVFSY